MSLVVGVGLRPGTPYAELLELANRFVDGEVAVVATLDERAAEPAVQQLAEQLGAEVRIFSKKELRGQQVPTPSERVERLSGVSSVAEAAVLATGARLVVTKQRAAKTTIAVGRLRAAGYAPADRDVVQRVIAERRDVRRGFVGAPIEDEVLDRVLAAAHRAPSVGLSQPWDFLLIRDLATRRKVHALATAQRDAFAASLPGRRRAAFDGLKIEAILDAPLNVAVTCDPGRGGRHVLGRHADPRTTWFSAAIAIQNLWLAARAEGIGVGWVSFFEPQDVAAVLGLPAHLELVGYLCVGYVEEFAPAPELVRSGWAMRRPLSWAVHHEQWGRRTTSIVDAATEAAQDGGRRSSVGERIRVVVGGDADWLRKAADLVVDLRQNRPEPNFGVLWRPARTSAEAVEYGVEIARDLALQGAGHLEVRLTEKSEVATALATGLGTGASACGLTHSLA